MDAIKIKKLSIGRDEVFPVDYLSGVTWISDQSSQSALESLSR